MGFRRASVMKNLLLSCIFFVLICAAFGTESEEVELESAKLEDLEGVVVERPNGSFMQLVFQDNKAHCYFFDAELKPIDPDVDMVNLLIFRRQPKAEREFTVAVPYEGVRGLRAPRYIRPPRIFRMNVSLLLEDVEEAVEYYVIYYPDDESAEEPIKTYGNENPDRAGVEKY